ncbi:MAG: hypothetical protein P1U89_00490 [Verrucomicrobiales bacterium]|nr:hypothetical protein [Verrucomicrobiales bacterium]
MTRFIRKQLKASLLDYGCEWQKQSFDNVLREKDRHRDAFQKVVGYVLDNPVRANYVDRWEDWKCCDSIIPGYPEVAIRDEDFWDRFWRIYYSKE